MRVALVISAAVLCTCDASDADAAKSSQQCTLPEARDADQPPRSVTKLTALIAQYEAGLDSLRRERAEAFQIARDAGSSEVVASGLDFPLSNARGWSRARDGQVAGA